MSAPESVPPAARAPPTVRLATRADMRVVRDMIQELADYEGMPDGPNISIDELIRDGFESSPAWFFVLVAELDGAVVGHALCNRAYSSWTRRALYVEDQRCHSTWQRCQSSGHDAR